MPFVGISTSGVGAADCSDREMSQIEVCKLLIEETSKPGNISDLI
jgi:hypothetical protein